MVHGEKNADICTQWPNKQILPFHRYGIVKIMTLILTWLADQKTTMVCLLLNGMFSIKRSTFIAIKIQAANVFFGAIKKCDNKPDSA